MTIAGVTTSYVASQIDLEAMQTADGGVALQNMTLTLVDDEGLSRKVTGIQKLIQRYTNLFLTALGSNKYDENIGSEFTAILLAGGITRREQIVQYFVFANARVSEALSSQEDDPTYGDAAYDDERLDIAELDSYSIDESTGQILLRIILTTDAGDQVTFVLPAQQM